MWRVNGGRTLARFFVFIGSLVVLALTAALVAPYFIDWTNYRDDFEREAGRVLGRDVRVEGTARARLLPFPSVTFTDVVVAGAEPGVTAMTIDEFSMDAELAPFLRGELLIFDMRLVRPSANLTIDPSGDIDWAVRPSSPFDPRQVTLENVTITDGTIAVHQQVSGRTIEFRDIDTVLSARTLAGPWRVNGSLSVDGTPIALSASTGSVGEDGAMRVRITAEPRDYPLVLETDGHARLENGEGLYAGTFRLWTVRPEVTQAADAPAESEDAGNRVAGRFSLSHERLAVEEFRFETGSETDPYTAEGEAVVELGAEPSFSITADGAQIRFDGPQAAEEGVSGRSVDERMDALTRFVTNLPKPTIPGTIAVNLPAIVAGDTTIREIEIRAEPAPEGWRIDSVAATLPGRTRFEGSGLLSTGEALGFNGHIVLAVRQPSGFAAWLARDVDEAIRRLPAAGFSADVALTRERQHFDNLELILGDARFRGAIDRRSPGNARPSLVFSLEGGRLDVGGLRALASLFIDDEGSNRLAGHDVDLEVAVGPVVADGLEAEQLDTALRLRRGEIEIDRLTINGLAEANISATGRVRDIGGEPTGQVDATVVAVDLAPLADLLSRRFPDSRLLAALDRNADFYPGLLEDTRVDIVVSAAESGDEYAELALNASGEAGGTDFSLSLSGGGSLANPSNTRLIADFTARNEEAASLYALFGLPALPLGLAGAAEADISASGTLSEGMDTTFRFFGEGLDARFEGNVAPEVEDLSLSGIARLAAEDVEPWLAAAGISLPGFGFGLPAELSAEVDYGEGLAVFSNLSGQIAGSAVAGDLNGEVRDGRPHLTGALSLGSLDLAVAAEMVVGSAALEESGEGWPTTPFRQQASAPFSADVEIVTDALFFGQAEADEALLRLGIDQEGFAVSNLSAHLLGGRLEGFGELRNNGGTGLFSAQFSLEGAELGELLAERALSGVADLSASLTASGKTVDGMVASLAGSGSVSLARLEIAGLDPDALPPILERADALGAEINAEQVAGFAPGLIKGGSFPAGSARLAFTVANGVARVPPVQLQADDVTMSVEASADFSDRTVTANGSITYDPGVEGVGGLEPVVRFTAHGPLGAAELQLDVEPLAQFLTQRALEREQERVEHMQAVLLEKQRLRRELRRFEEIAAARAAAEAERVRLEREAERLRKAEEARQAEATRQREQERREAEARAAEERRRQAEEEAARQQGREPQGNSEIERQPLPPPSPEPESGSSGDSAAGQSEEEPPLRLRDANLERLLEMFGQPR